MLLNNFWFISLCVLMIISANIGLSIPLRIALAANAIVILLDVIKGVRRLYNECCEKEN